MVQASSTFNLASCFKVSLIPQSGSDENRLTAQDLEKIKTLINLEKFEAESQDLTESVRREQEYLEKYQSQVLPERANRVKEQEVRGQRYSRVQQQILEEENERSRLIQLKRDQEFAAKLKADEKAKLEQERAQRQQEQERDNQAVTLCGFIQGLDFFNARRMLEEC